MEQRARRITLIAICLLCTNFLLVQVQSSDANEPPSAASAQDGSAVASIDGNKETLPGPENSASNTNPASESSSVNEPQPGTPDAPSAAVVPSSSNINQISESSPASESQPGTPDTPSVAAVPSSSNINQISESSSASESRPGTPDTPSAAAVPSSSDNNQISKSSPTPESPPAAESQSTPATPAESTPAGKETPASQTPPPGFQYYLVPYYNSYSQVMNINAPYG